MQSALAPLASLLLEAVKDLCQAEAASILELDGAGNLVFRLVEGGVGDALQGVELDGGSGVAGRVLTTGQGEIVNHMQGDVDHVDVDDAYPVHSLVAAPLLDRDGRAVGVVEAVNAAHGGFDDVHLEALCSVALPLASALTALDQLDEDPSAIGSFYASVAAVAGARTQSLKERTSALEDDRRSFELDPIRAYRDEKMAGLARMACGIAHEVNNPLAAVRSNLCTIGSSSARLRELMQKVAGFSGDDSDEVSELLVDLAECSSEAITELSRVVRISERLRAFGESDLDRVEQLDLCAEARRVGMLIEEHGSRGDVQVRVDAEQTVTFFSAAAQVRQVLLELIDNAARAALASETDGEAVVDVRVFESPVGAHVTVSDRGPGIPAHLQDRVFDPFFTTKADWNATGLGLTAAYGITRALGASIALDSVPGRGTTVTLTFPPTEPVLERASPERGGSRARSTGRYYEDLA